MRLATFNVENLFERVAVFQEKDEARRNALVAAHGEVEALFALPLYGGEERARMKALLKTLGLARGDESDYAFLRQNRGRLRSGPTAKQPFAITATGRDDWVGHVALKTEPVNAEAIRNTGRVMQLVQADVLALVEAESRPALVRFRDQVLRDEPDYPHAMLIDGNDKRGIDVGLLTGPRHRIRRMISHVDDPGPEGGTVFARDCPEYEVMFPGGSIWVLVNHFSSKRGGASAAERRRHQAERVRDIAAARLRGSRYVAVVGDLNDGPESKDLAPLLKDSGLVDVATLAGYDDGGVPGTYGAGYKGDRIDYILLSPALAERATAAGVERSGVWDSRKTPKWRMLDTVRSEATAASDHAAVWVDLDMRRARE